MTNKKAVTYRIYCPFCKHLWILKAPEEVTTPLYKAWVDLSLAEHKKIELERKKTWWERFVSAILKKINDFLM